ncbi:YraN family protein [Streptomyces luteogriseus]|uniref:YraN family protein n=1 Tax=Streptomyces luteogriseus TaxID=68233 RepID=UPI0036BBAB16
MRLGRRGVLPLLLPRHRLTEQGPGALAKPGGIVQGWNTASSPVGDVLVVCEVKTRRAGPFEHPMAAVTPQKAARLRDLAERWIQTHGGAPPGGVRIDLVGVLLPARGAAMVEHVRGVA